MGEKIKRNIKNLVNIADCLYEAIIEMIYPMEDYCIICYREDCRGICEPCLKSITKVENYDNIRSYGYYTGVLKKLILKFKFGGNFTAGTILADILGQYIKENYDIEKYTLLYVPITKKTEKKRGFNQCEYIAKKISKNIGVDYSGALIKIKDTKEQKGLSKQERNINVKGAFKLKENSLSLNKGVILIDDVLTTGATLMEAYKVLCENNIKDIKLLTLAKSTI